MYKISKVMYLMYILQMFVFTFLWLKLKLKLKLDCGLLCPHSYI